MAAQSVQILPGLSDSQLPTARSADVSVIDVQSTLFRGPSFLCESSETSKRTASLIDVIHDDKIDIEEEERVYRAFDQNDEAHTPECATFPLRSSNSSAARHRGSVSFLSSDISVGECTEECIAFSRGITIVGWTNVGDKLGGAYVVYDCAILTSQGTTIHTLKRYSAFVELHSLLMRSLPDTLRRQITPLPSRSPLAKYRPAFLDKRRRMLQQWLTSVLLHPEIGGCTAVREWITC